MIDEVRRIGETMVCLLMLIERRERAQFPSQRAHTPVQDSLSCWTLEITARWPLNQNRSPVSGARTGRRVLSLECCVRWPQRASDGFHVHIGAVTSSACLFPNQPKSSPISPNQPPVYNSIILLRLKEKKAFLSLVTNPFLTTIIHPIIAHTQW